ncbi:MAG: hypothetical protein Q9174_000186 [Haloplaca sp. 1 TL-2023]
MPSMVSSAAMQGFADASSYDKHRPSYSPGAVEDLLAKLQVKDLNKARVVDLGAGTGKFTETLAGRNEGYEITAVEPNEQMINQLEGKKLKGVRAAWHWFATDEALEEIHRVLVPGGTLGLIWNVEDYNAPKSWEPQTTWEAKMKDLMWSYDDQQPRFRHEKWRQVFDKQFHSLSQIAILDGAELVKVKEKVFAALNAPEAERNGAGELPLHGRVVYAWTTAVPGAPLKNGG